MVSSFLAVSPTVTSQNVRSNKSQSYHIVLQLRAPALDRRLHPSERLHTRQCSARKQVLGGGVDSIAGELVLDGDESAGLDGLEREEG